MAPRRSLRLAELQPFLLPLVCHLPLDVIADDLLGQTTRAAAVATCPDLSKADLIRRPMLLTT
jgi:hypothetical protein